MKCSISCISITISSIDLCGEFQITVIKLTSFDCWQGHSRNIVKAVCFTKTWLQEHILGSKASLPGSQPIQADRDCRMSGKSKGGGIAVLMETTNGLIMNMLR